MGRATGGPVMRAKSAGFPFGGGEGIRLRRDAAVLRQIEAREHPRTHRQLELELEYRDFQVGYGADIERAHRAEEHRAFMEEMRHQMAQLQRDREELVRERDAFEARRAEAEARRAEAIRDEQDEEAMAHRDEHED